METVGVLPSCPLRGCRNVPAVRRRCTLPLRFSEKTPRPLGTNTPAQFAYPIYSVQKETEKRHSQRCAVSLIYSIFCAQIMEIFEPSLLFSGSVLLLQQVCEQAQRLAALPEQILCDGQIKPAVEQHLLAARRHIMCDHTHLLIHACSFECASTQPVTLRFAI